MQALPTPEQANILSSWIGSAKTIWNAKCDEDRYLRTFARKYLPLGMFPPINAEYSQYKNKELTPWLFECPSQILRNSASNWYYTYRDFLKGQCGRPQRKKVGRPCGIYLTNDLFKFEKSNGKLELHVGTKKFSLGVLKVNYHAENWFNEDLPKSITIKKSTTGKFSVSFCYEDKFSKEEKDLEQEELLKKLALKPLEENESQILGIDRGINVLLATKLVFCNPTSKDKSELITQDKKIKKYQKRLARQIKGSKRRLKTKNKIAKSHEKIKNIRENIAHQTSKIIVNLDAKILVLENLKLKNMTRSSKGTLDLPGKKVKQKSGLNRSLLNQCLGKIDIYLSYKARRANKKIIKVDPKYTSQECAECAHIHPENRTGIKFKCLSCGHEDHADQNAARVLEKRCIQLIYQNPGTGLSQDKGHGAKIRPMDILEVGTGVEMSKKKRPLEKEVVEARLL